MPALFLPVTEPHVHQFLADRTDVANRATTLSVANATMSIVIATSIFGGAWIMDEFGFLTAMRIFACATAVLLVIGFASGSIPKLAVNLALVKEFSVVGVFWGAFTRSEPDEYKLNMIELFNWYQKGLLKPLIEESYPLSQAASVLEKILDRGSKGKITLNP